MTPFTETDRVYMEQALALARRGLYTTTPNPRVGCVIVKGGRVIGAGFTQPAGQAHAEVRALQACVEDPSGAEVYVSLEPCSHHGRTPPCVEALLAAKVARVVAAMQDPNPRVSGQGFARLRAAGVRVECGLLESEARELNIGFVHRFTAGRPWVRVKMAASLDGRTALANGTSQWITGEAARRDGHHWRARACAILTGVGTVRQDDPRLTARGVDTPRQPLRVIVDRRREVPAGAKALAGGALLACAAGDRADLPPQVEVLRLPDPSGRVDLDGLVRTLAARGVNELHVESGAKLAGALLEAGLVDELLLYLAPMLLGDSARGMFAVPALERLEDCWRLAVRSVEPVGEDWRVLARVERG